LIFTISLAVFISLIFKLIKRQTDSNGKRQTKNNVQLEEPVFGARIATFVIEFKFPKKTRSAYPGRKGKTEKYNMELTQIFFNFVAVVFNLQ
jgi:hypothetical protein